MSTEIKPGQEVRAIRDAKSAFSSDIDMGTRCVVKDPNYDGGRHSVAEAGYTLSVYLLGDAPANTLLVKPEDFEPAPLDPTLVKAGDTVTLSRKGAHLTDVVSQTVTANGGGFTLSIAPSRWFYIDNGWTLTAHQPAPEPEPEWRGKFISGATDDGVRVIGFVDEDGDFFGIEEGRRHLRGVLLENLTDVRPLVVIDQATVDVEALAAVAVSAHSVAQIDPKVPHVWRHVVSSVLADLGIEAP